MKKVFLPLFTAMMITGGNLMAGEYLNNKEEAIAKVSAYTALGNQEKLKTAIGEGLDAGGSNEWLEPVSDEEYNKLK